MNGYLVDIIMQEAKLFKTTLWLFLCFQTSRTTSPVIQAFSFHFEVKVKSSFGFILCLAASSSGVYALPPEPRLWEGHDQTSGKTKVIMAHHCTLLFGVMLALLFTLFCKLSAFSFRARSAEEWRTRCCRSLVCHKRQAELHGGETQQQPCERDEQKPAKHSKNGSSLNTIDLL